jgi:hypothetical protein
VKPITALVVAAAPSFSEWAVIRVASRSILSPARAVLAPVLLARFGACGARLTERLLGGHPSMARNAVESDAASPNRGC